MALIGVCALAEWWLHWPEIAVQIRIWEKFALVKKVYQLRISDKNYW